MKILVVEDEKELRESIVQFLQQEQYTVEWADDYHTALDKVLVYDYDCILLDLGLPGGNGLQVLKEWKDEGKTGAVMIVSAKDSLDDKVNGLNLGADDYLAKPFHMAELHARVKSVLRRRTLGGNALLHFNNITINTEDRTVFVNEKELLLNRKEFDVLLYFVVNKNRLVNKTALAESVWGDHIDAVDSFDFIYSQIKHLRKKLKEAGAEAAIQAVYGIGYKLSGE